MKTKITKNGDAQVTLSKAELKNLVFLLSYNTDNDIIRAGCKHKTLVKVEEGLQILFNELSKNETKTFSHI